jgi:hypothetical protein
MGHVVCMEDMKRAYKHLVRKSEGKISFGRPRHGWMDNTKIYLKMNRL